MAIQDDKGAWDRADRRSEGGKLLLLDEADYGTQHIFFDDMANEDQEGSVYAFDPIANQEIPFKRAVSKYIVKVESLRAISEPDYFIKLIEQAEQRRTEEIEKVESGAADEAQAQRQGSQYEEWTKLQEASNEEYLMKTILPVLYQGMKVVDLERPEAPLEYLALYLLKHQDQIKLPPKPQKA